MIKPTVPSSTQPISGGGGIVTTVWQRFFNALIASPGAIESVAATSSPFTFKPSQSGCLSIAGGTISDVTLKRASISISLGTPRLVPVANGDEVTVTFSVTPTLSFIPS